jgi:hypothetical protein
MVPFLIAAFEADDDALPTLSVEVEDSWREKIRASPQGEVVIKR